MSEPVEKIRLGWLYKLTAPSGKGYIGQTVQEVKARWAKHKKQAESGMTEDCCRALAAAIRKYGWESFKKEIIWEGPESELDAKEIEFIKTHGTFWKDGGYNLTTGGRATKMSEDTKAHMRKSALKSARVYAKRDPSLPRGVQVSKDGKSYRVEVIDNEGNRVQKTFSVFNYADQESAKQAAIAHCAELRSKFE